ncbi:PAS domain S-box-containing protein [Mariprofundus ferrinatatus]|uniref:histidine kinase n=1 Tax=Mariprofundus ferrinatatus TaxID=1921087 RepID=A0A2K8L3I2_9PROT|nr:PAS domain S-box protein [Mariprofundus ferrinatatus]ATX81837.1 PAS domain S-box-containing protein [Mariprofundus ferrinatatus]
MSNKDTSYFYLHCVARLTIIILVAEVIDMMIFEATIHGTLHPFTEAILDGLLLIILSIYPLYLFVYTPILQRFRKSQQQIEMLAEALQGAGESVIITRPDGTIIYVNQAFSEITGYSQEEVIGKNPRILQSGKQDRNFYERMWGSIRRNGQWKGELWNKRKNGELYPEALDVRAIPDDAGKTKFLVGVFSDLTEQKRVENALLHSQKLEAIGTLVGGVAHNFNNLLAAISGKAYITQMKAKKNGVPAEITGHLDDIQSLSFEASHLIKQLLAFSRESQHDKENTDLKALVMSALTTAQIGIPEDVEVELDLSDEPMTIFADQAHIKQAIINIINNARDAVIDSEKKEICIRLSRTIPSSCDDNGSCNIHCKNMARLEIHGSGINSADIEKVFEPFFTTKDVGKGTGLGLSTAHGIIASHNGTIHVSSTFSKGTTFRICLPLVETEENKKESTKRSTVKASQSATILVADDAAEVRQTIASILESFGYQVVQACDGVDALEKFCAHQRDISLLITDIVMPKKDGLDSALEMRKANPELPVIFITGYDASRERTSHLVDDETSLLLNKPFKSEELIGRVTKLLKIGK